MAAVLSVGGLTGWAAACDGATGPVPAEDLPFATEVERDGLRIGLYSAVAGDEWVLGAWVKNVADTTIERRFPGGCMVTGIAAYREREFGEPAWRLSEIPGHGACATDAITVRLFPDQTETPDRWQLGLPISRVVGDSLEAGLYRFSSRTLSVGGSIGDDVEVIAADPIRLERCFPVPRPESSTTPDDRLPFPTEVEEGGLRFRVRSEMTDCGDRWRLWVSARNVSDEEVIAEFPADCMIAELVAYREGEFAEPAWRAADVPALSECDEDDVLGFLRRPGETIEPSEWNTGVSVRSVLGDSLETGFYRLGSERVEVDGEIGGDAAEMIAPVPLRLERSP